MASKYKIIKRTKNGGESNYKTGAAALAFGALVGVTLSTASYAYDTYDRDVNEVTGFIPSLLIRHGNDDNVNRVNEDNVDATESDVTETRFNVLMGGSQRANRYNANYTALSKNFRSADELDYVDHHFVSNIHLEANSRNQFDIRAGYHKQTDRLSSLNRSDARETEGDRYSYTDLGLTYGFGEENTKAQLEFGVDFQSREYDNNLDTASLNRLKDRDVTTARATFFYKISPKTRALFELRQQDFDYQDSDSRLSSTSQAALVGITWDATANTKGTVKVGYQEKDFDDEALNDGDNLAWEARMDWSPQDRDLFTFRTARSQKEGSVRENFVDSATISARWRHDWSDVVVSDVTYAHFEDKYEGGTTDGRKDNGDSLDLGLRYKFRRWMTLGAGYRYTDNNSDIDIEEYDSNQYFFDVNFTLR